MIKQATLLSALALSVGCTSTEERIAEYKEEAHKVCIQLASTESQYEQCVYNEVQASRAARQQSMQAMGSALSEMGAYCQGGKTVGPYNLYVPNC